MKYTKIVLFLLFTNFLIGQSPKTDNYTSQNTNEVSSYYILVNDNLNPPITLIPISLKDVELVFDSTKTFQYYISYPEKQSKKSDVLVGKAFKKYIAYTSLEGNVELLSLQDFGRVLKESTQTTKDFSEASDKLFKELNSIPQSQQNQFFTLLASNSIIAKAWLALEEAGYSLQERTNIEVLQDVADYFIKYPGRTIDDFDTTVSEFSDKLNYLEILPDIVYNPSVKGTRYNDFVSVSGFNGNFHQSEYSFYLWKEEEWKKLEKFFNANNINGGWPPNNGGYYEIHNVPLIKGQKFDRYGSVLKIDSTLTPYEPILTGTFTAPIENGRPFSFTQRALNKPEDDYDLYFEIEVLKDLPFTSLDATVIPWFDQEGNGKQAMWNIPNAANGYPMTWNDLVDLDYIIIRVKKSPNNKYSQFANTVIK